MITVGGKNFKTKQTLTNYCKFVLNNADLDSLLQGEWESVMNDVLNMHQDFHGKTKGQPFKIGVRACQINPMNRQFFILREDGTDTDFSYYKCISGKSKESRIKETLRACIKYQSDGYKEQYFFENADRQGYVACAETGLKIRKRDSHIDHFPVQFDEIVKEWVDINNLRSEDIVLVKPSKDNSTFWPFEDQELLQSFLDYHQKVATYRIVLNKVNLQRKRPKKFNF